MNPHKIKGSGHIVPIFQIPIDNHTNSKPNFLWSARIDTYQTVAIRIWEKVRFHQFSGYDPKFDPKFDPWLKVHLTKIERILTPVSLQTLKIHI